jgi:hypothetical protein
LVLRVKRAEIRPSSPTHRCARRRYSPSSLMSIRVRRSDSPHLRMLTSRRRQEVRRHLRAAHQHRPQSGRSHVVQQAAVDWNKPFAPASISFRPVRFFTNWTKRSGPRVLFIPCPDCEKGVGRPHHRLGRVGSWPGILADLESLTETEFEQDGKRFMLRSAPQPAATLALRAAGVALPPTVHLVD